MNESLPRDTVEPDVQFNGAPGQASTSSVASAAEDLDEPRITELCTDELQVYGRPYEERFGWRTVRSPIAIALIGAVVGSATPAGRVGPRCDAFILVQRCPDPGVGSDVLADGASPCRWKGALSWHRGF